MISTRKVYTAMAEVEYINIRGRKRVKVNTTAAKKKEKEKEELLDYTIGRGGKRIKVNTAAAEKKKEELRKLELERYEVKIPSPSGDGETRAQIEEMARIMKELYEEVQNLIVASEKMIGEISRTFFETDQGGGGTSVGRF